MGSNMEGKNKITLCRAEMCRIVALGLNDAWISYSSRDIVVSDITHTQDDDFVIDIHAAPKEETE